MTLPVDAGKIRGLFAFIVKGLMWHHWRTLLGDDDEVDVHLPGRKVDQFFARFSALRCKSRVTGNPGEGTFAYRGMQGVDNDAISVWEFSAYGGVMLEADTPGEIATRIWAMTGPRQIERNFEMRRKASGAVLLGIRD